MNTKYDNIVTMDGHRATSFTIRTRKGMAHGLFTDNRIFVHLIEGRGAVKGLMTTLINKFKTNLVTFTPLINDNIKNTIRGDLKICPADHENNPYKEDFEYLECVWK